MCRMHIVPVCTACVAPRLMARALEAIERARTAKRRIDADLPSSPSSPRPPHPPPLTHTQLNNMCRTPQDLKLQLARGARMMALLAIPLARASTESLTAVYARTFEKAAFGFAKVRPVCVCVCVCV